MASTAGGPLASTCHHIHTADPGKSTVASSRLRPSLNLERGAVERNEQGSVTNAHGFTEFHFIKDSRGRDGKKAGFCDNK